MPTKTHPKGSIMSNQHKPHESDTSLVEAVSVNAKLGAAALVTAVGYAAGSFVSLADTASNHAKRNPEGIVNHALTTTLVDQYVESRASGYNITEKAKDVVDFSKQSLGNKKIDDTKNA